MNPNDRLPVLNNSRIIQIVVLAKHMFQLRKDEIVALQRVRKPVFRRLPGHI